LNGARGGGCPLIRRACWALLALVLSAPLGASPVSDAITVRDARECGLKALRWLQAAQARDSGDSYSRHYAYLTRPANHEVYNAEAETMRELWESGEPQASVHGRIFRACLAERSFQIER
jgi:hypothetical protein